MADSNIELSKDGIKISYRRYLSDSTPGFILILFLIGIYYNFELGVFQRIGSSEVKALVLLLLFFLATPIGIIINAVGWLFLEAPQKLLEKKLFANQVLKGFEDEYDLAKCRLKFGIKADGSNWFERVRTLETALLNDFPSKSGGIEALRGLAIMFRSLSLMLILGSGFCGLICLKSPCLIFFVCAMLHAPIIVAFLILALLFFCLSAIISFYFHVQIVHSAFILSENENAKLLEKVINKIATEKS